MAKKHTPFVIAYDFDGTLASGNMQEYDFIPVICPRFHGQFKRLI